MARLNFFEACRKYGIKKPVIGIELNMQGDGEEEPISLLLLAKNAAGYRNLVKISSNKLSENSLDPHDNPQTCDDIKDCLDRVAVIVSPESIKVAKLAEVFQKAAVQTVQNCIWAKGLNFRANFCLMRIGSQKL